MRRGFTILELLVASLLLGMLMTILTMVFNQSSISWRTGIAGLIDMDEVRDNLAAVRDEADNIYLWNNKIHRTLSIWKEESSTPTLRKRTIDVDGGGDVEQSARVGFLASQGSLKQDGVDPKNAFGPVNVKTTQATGGRTWIVNVKSCGPNRILNDYDDIWSNPDDFE